MPITIETAARFDVVDVTERVAERIPEDVEHGLSTVFVPHTTAGVIVNEHEQRLLADIEGALEALFPWGEDYEHDAIDDNAAAHLRATMLGESVSIPIADGHLALGTWQSVLFLECDGPRRRSVEVSVRT